MNNSITILRIITSAGLLLAVIAFGYTMRSSWVILPLALIFTVSFVFGRWQSWLLALSMDGIFSALLEQWKTFIVQLVLCGILYLTGRGLNTVFSDKTQSTVLGQTDIWALLALVLFTFVGGFLVMILEKKILAHVDDEELEQAIKDAESEIKDEGDDGFRVDLAPITLETFFEGHHTSNKDHVYDDTQETVVNPDRAYVSEVQIAEVEKDLDIQLPKKLRGLYLIQNGGYVGGLATPLVENPSHSKYEDWLMPFSGYDNLYTLNGFCSVYESVTEYAEPESLEDFPKGCKRMFVIAQWYRHTLFLDYRNSEEPRIGFVDFDEYEDLQDDYWESQAHWWDDFDTFFAQLRHSEWL